MARAAAGVAMLSAIALQVAGCKSPGPASSASTMSKRPSCQTEIRMMAPESTALHKGGLPSKHSPAAVARMAPATI